MGTAIRTITRVQDADDVATTPGAGTNGLAMTWDAVEQKFVLGAKTQPVFVFTFDDVFASQYTYAFPRLAEFGWNGTLFVPTGDGVRIGTGGCMSASQITAMYEAGWEIGSHTVNHVDLSGVNEATLISELEDSKAAIISYGWGTPRSFAYPSGIWSNAIIDKVKLYYDYARSIIVGYHVDNAMEYRVRALGEALSGYRYSWADLVVQVNECARRGGLCVFYTHGVQNPDLPYHTSTRHFDDLCDLVYALGYRVMTFTDAMDAYRARAAHVSNLILNPDLALMDYANAARYLDWTVISDASNALTFTDSVITATSGEAATAYVGYTLGELEPDVTYRFGFYVSGDIASASNGLYAKVEGPAGFTAVLSSPLKGSSLVRSYVYRDFSYATGATPPSQLTILWALASGSATIYEIDLRRMT